MSANHFIFRQFQGEAANLIFVKSVLNAVLVLMSLESEADQIIQQLRIGLAGRLPQQGIHAERSKSGHRIYFINVDLPARFSGD